MPRKRKEDETDINNLIQSLDITSENAGIISSGIRGRDIVLNLTQESFFGVGDKIWLTPNNYTCKIPENLTYEEEKIIRTALAAGSIRLGTQYIPNITRDKEVLAEYWSYVKQYGLSTITDQPGYKTYEKFRKTLLKYGTDRNWTAKEIAKYCIEQEKQYKNRSTVIKLLNEVVLLTNCPDTLLHTPEN